MADDVKRIVIEFSGESEDAQASIQEVLALLATLDHVDVDAEANVATAGAQADIDKLFAALKALDQEDVTVDVNVDVDKALADAKVQFREVTANVNNLRSELARVEQDFSQFKAVRVKDEIKHVLDASVRELDLLAARIKSLEGLKATPKVEVDVDAAQLALFDARFAELDHAEAHPEVDVQTAKADAQFAELLAKMAAIDATDVEIDVDVDTGNLSLAGKLLSAFGIQTGNADKGLEEFSSGIGRLNVNLPGMLGRLNAVSGAAFALAIAIGVTLVGALGALVSSLAAALAGLAALAAGFAAALGPALLLVIAVVSRLAAVWKVLKQEDEAALQAEQQRIQGNKAVVSALEQRRQAYLQLRRASEDVAAAETDALREVEDAAERATDAILGLARAQLSEADAALGIKEAEFELKKFIHDMKVGEKQAESLFKKFTDVDFNPADLNKQLRKVKVPGVSGLDKQEQELKLERLILNIKDARLREKEATDGVSDAIREKSRAEEDNLKFVREGIKASPRYVAALRAQADAHRAVKDAQKAVADAGVLAAQAKVQAMTTQLSKKEQVLLNILRQVREDFKKTFSPALEKIIGGIAIGLGLIGKRIKVLRGSFTKLGDAMGAAVVAIIDHFTSPEMLQTFQQFANMGTILILPLVSILESLGDILIHIAQAALPLLLPLLAQVAVWFSQLATSTSDIGNLRGIIATLVEHFRAWLDAIIAVGGVLLEFFKQAAPFGLQLAHAITNAANGLKAWAQSEKGRAEIREFLEVAVPFAIKFAGFIGRLVAFFIRLGEVAAPILGPLLTIFSRLIAINTTLLRIVSRVSKVIGDILNTVVGIMDDVIAKLQSFVEKFIQLGIDFIGGIIKGMVKKAKDLVGKAGSIAKDVLHAVSHPWELGSPSKVTEGYGKALVEGIIKGIEDTAKDLTVAARVSLETPILDPLQANVRAAPHLAVAAAAATNGTPAQGGRAVHLEQNITTTDPDPLHLANRTATFLDNAIGRSWQKDGQG